ncbi:hypothetical protein B6U66_03020 [Candidatus Bathyarchaeota archaeon ex4484_135]|nr:MAG: hypothetical protein B6U66_03020 [Candidatus Bathyarchaeota archaeon ex4484_135]
MSGDRRLVKRFRILGPEKNPLVPCAGVVAELDADLKDLMPVLFLRNVGRASYVPDKGVLTIRHGGRLITFYPDGKVVVGRAWTEEAAREVLREVMDMVNEAYGELLREGPPSQEEIEKAMRLSWRVLLELLPGENCGRCGRRTCQAFSVDVLRGEAKLSDCPLLKENAKLLERARSTLGRRLAKALGL